VKEQDTAITGRAVAAVGFGFTGDLLISGSVPKILISWFFTEDSSVVGWGFVGYRNNGMHNGLPICIDKLKTLVA
jgi:hypothetical protein